MHGTQIFSEEQDEENEDDEEQNDDSSSSSSSASSSTSSEEDDDDADGERWAYSDDDQDDKQKKLEATHKRLLDKNEAVARIADLPASQADVDYPIMDTDPSTRSDLRLCFLTGASPSRSSARSAVGDV